MVVELLNLAGGPPLRAEAAQLIVYDAMGTPVMVLAVDAAVHAARKVSSLSDLKKVAVGGGGTDMVEGIAAAAKHKSDVIVVLTDGWTPWPAPDAMPRQRVVAAVVGDADVPAHLRRSLVRVKEDR